jgi:hypothetical protein
MKKFDRYIKAQLLKEETAIPESVQCKIDWALMNLPENEAVLASRKPRYVYDRIAAAAACFVFVFLLLLPNVSMVYAQALEQIPVIGKIVKVVTIRNYFYLDDKHELDISVPQIEEDENKAIDYINADAEELTEALVQRFYHDLDELGSEFHGSVYVDYEVITNTENWFTLKLRVNEAYGSGNTYYKYYNLDKVTGKIATLSDIVKDEAFYAVAENEIKEQMRQRMQQDSTVKYWIQGINGNAPSEDFVMVTPEHNYYWDEDGNLVIPYDKYEVAPGYMGTPEFVIDYKLIQDMLKKEID